MATAKRSDKGRQRGQAMVELVIVAVLALLPLFLAIPIIGKYIDVRTAAVESSRYAAWERTVWYGGASASSIEWNDVTSDLIPSSFDWFDGIVNLPSGWFKSSNSWQANEKTDARIRNEIAVRLLSRSSSRSADDAFSAADKDAADFRNGGTRTLWRARDGSPLLRDYTSDVSQDMGNDAAPGTVNKVLKPIALLAAVLGPFTLEMKGEYTASVTLKTTDYSTASAPTMADWSMLTPGAGKLGFTESTVLLANGWNAGGPGKGAPNVTSVSSQVAGLTPFTIFKQEAKIPTPTGELESVVNALNAVLTVAKDIAKKVILILFPELDKLDLGRIEPDKVPADRLSAESAEPPGDE